MTLKEMAQSYRASAEALRGRIRELEELLPDITQDKRSQIQYRIRILSSMQRQTKELAVLLDRYYERSHCSNGKHTI